MKIHIISILHNCKQKMADDQSHSSWCHGKYELSSTCADNIQFALTIDEWLSC